MLFLGLDIGTSSVKAVLTDAAAVLAQSAAPLPISRPRPNWSEQNPEHWWQAVDDCVRQFEPQQRRAIAAIGLSGQMHGAVLLDDDDRVLRPVILWNDGRAGAESAELERAAPTLRETTGNIAMPGFTAPKLVWVRKYEPEVFLRTRCVLLPKDYVRLVMTGEKATDVSDASGTLWLDVGRRAWSAEMLAACELTLNHMPRVCEGPEITGRLRAEIAEAWGMERVPVVAGGGDNAAGATGAGIIDDGDAFISLGTSGVIFAAGRAFLKNPERTVHAFCHCLPERWHQMSVMLSAASCVDWAAKACGVASAAEFHERIAAERRVDGPEIFLPYLSGERTPHNDPNARGVLVGLDHDTDAVRIGQAVLEGVAFAFADGLDALTESGASVAELTVIGGGSRSDWWGQVLACVLGRRLVYREGADLGPAMGAARLAQIASTGAAAEEVCTPGRIVSIIEPDAATADALAAKREIFKQLYPALHFAYQK